MWVGVFFCMLKSADKQKCCNSLQSAALVGPAGFGEPRPKKALEGHFCPAGRKRRARAVQILPGCPLGKFIMIKKMQPLTRLQLVGPAGFEPTDGGVKVLCLTAWRRPIMKKDRAACITVRSLVGCLERFELSASRATIWRANQLRHRHHKCARRDSNPRPTA